jgi:hypothetical protein
MDERKEKVKKDTRNGGMNRNNEKEKTKWQ